MFLRILVVVLVLNGALFLRLLFPLLLLALLTMFMAYFIGKKKSASTGKIQLGSPFTLAPALKFAGLFALIVAVAKLANIYLSSQGIYIVSFLSGLADMDAIAISLSQLSQHSIALSVAFQGIMIGALASVVFKAGLASWMGGKEFKRIVIGFFTIIIVVGVVLLVLS